MVVVPPSTAIDALSFHLEPVRIFPPVGGPDLPWKSHRASLDT